LPEQERGAYTAFPAAISRLVILDGVPIIDALEWCTETFGMKWWQWFFYCQPQKPERAIMADPDAWYGGSAHHMGDEPYLGFHSAIHDPDTVHTMIEDYQTGTGIDRVHDADNRDHGRTIACPTLVLRVLKDDLEQLYGDPLDVWRPWSPNVEGHGLDCGHHMAEEIPEELAATIAKCIYQSGRQTDRSWIVFQAHKCPPLRAPTDDCCFRACLQSSILSAVGAGPGSARQRRARVGPLGRPQGAAATGRNRLQTRPGPDYS
jgi:hypothetical protein